MTQRLRDFNYDINYATSKSGELITHFLAPCVLSSNTYLRASGYFSSAMLALVLPELTVFIESGGKIKLICSPNLSEHDAQAILSPSNSFDAQSLAIALETNEFRTGAEILSYLLSSNHLEIRFATLDRDDGLFHEKFGAFSDRDLNAVSFTGSVNETYRGWSNAGNSESIDVFVSWNERDSLRVKRHQERFQQLWDNKIPEVYTSKPSPELIKLADENADIGHLAFSHLRKKLNRKVQAKSLKRRKPLWYQAEVLENWESGKFRGLVKFCTGAGKTVVALKAIEACFDDGFPVIVLVPSKLLLLQWKEELSSEFPSAKLLVAGDGNNLWRDRRVLRSHLNPIESQANDMIVLSTMDTAASEEFLKNIKSNHFAVFVDECHQIGSEFRSRFLATQPSRRLGLSATPERHGDSEGTEKVFNYFGHVLDPVIDIPKAIELGRLVPYHYDLSFVYLNDDEDDRYLALSRQILTLSRQADDSNKSNAHEISERLKTLRINRARIVKKARAKLDLAIEKILEGYQPGQRWLIYVEDSEDLQYLNQALKEKVTTVTYFTNQQTSLNNNNLSYFTQHGAVMLSMRCLDEGVDIPAVDTAFVLASSQNPRQFVQRRGRVLRASPGKTRALIHDIFVIPGEETGKEYRPMLLAEACRAIEFAEYASNIEAKAKLRSIIARYGFTIEEILGDDHEINDEQTSNHQGSSDE